MEESINKFMAESTKRHDKNYILFKEICSLTDFGIWNQGASIKALEIQIGQMSKVLQERGSRSLPSSTETNLRYHVNSISTTIKIDMTSICRIGGARYAILDNPNRMQTFKPNQLTIPFPCRLTNDCYEEMNVLDFATYGVFEEGRRMEDQVRRSVNEDPDLGASVSVMPPMTFTNLGLGDLAPTKLTFELADRTIKYPKGVAENVLVGIGKFVFPVDFVVLDMPEDVKVPLILERSFLSNAHAKIDDKVEYKGKNVVGSFLNVPIFVGKFSIVTHFEIVENIDGYRDQDMGDVIFGEPFYKASCVGARRFDRLITIHNGNDNVTYQMARSHPRFKHLSNAQGTRSWHY
ncbi:hypothetical protein Tco_0454269 [Tanacetum coccineum]